eukprot:TRINITY_DN3474_c0_g1_i2.p1 TRINITY_DN3474_c0_g1~~TRINITY_DN3474_c0_g1_i2.p1  ORF type:complete len:555 (+),score=136.68 TRINITY_DN3474_c0_g1_i2:31-1695(+)
MDNKNERRTHVLQELFNTERHYVKDLLVVRDVFIIPTRAQNLLPKKDFIALFCNIEAITTLHQEILAEFELIDKGIGMTVGQVFLERVDRFKLYAAYCSNQSFVVSRLSSIRANNKPFATFLDEAFKNSRCRLLPLDSFLILPLQRVCKYPLLLKELLQSTESTAEEEKQSLQQALDQLKQKVDQVNEKTREVEHLQKVLEIQGMVENGRSYNLLSPKRRLIKEGPLTHKKKQIHLLLFNDLLVGAKITRRSTYFILFFVPLSPDIGLRPDIPNDVNIELVVPSGESFVFSANTPEQKIEWREELDRTISQMETSSPDDLMFSRKFLASSNTQSPATPTTTTTKMASSINVQRNANPSKITFNNISKSLSDGLSLTPSTPSLITIRQPSNGHSHSLLRALSFRGGSKIDIKEGHLEKTSLREETAASSCQLPTMSPINSNNITSQEDSEIEEEVIMEEEVNDKSSIENEVTDYSGEAKYRKSLAEKAEEIAADQKLSVEERLKRVSEMAGELEKEKFSLGRELSSLRRDREKEVHTSPTGTGGSVLKKLFSFGK